MVSKHAAWAVALFPLTLAYAQPQIAVKARAYVDDVRAFARGRDVTVTGALRDDRGHAQTIYSTSESAKKVKMPTPVVY